MKYVPKTLEEVIQNHVDSIIQTCEVRKNNGFRVVEVELPIEFCQKVFTKLNEEIGFGTRLRGWQFQVFSSGEFEGKMAQTYKRDGIDYKRYFLKYNG